jgi:hypothetical protein
VSDPDLTHARAMLAMFSPSRPMMVGQYFYDAVKAHGGFNDLIDRMKVNPTMPVHRVRG